MFQDIIYKQPYSRCKSISYLPSKNLIASTHYDGTITYITYQSNSIKKTVVKVTDEPIRTSTFMNEYLVIGTDEGKLMIYNYDILIYTVQAHKDFVRRVSYSKGHILSASDDCTCKLWKVDFQLLSNLSAHTFSQGCLSLLLTFDKHTHFVMDCCFKEDQADDEFSFISDINKENVEAIENEINRKNLDKVGGFDNEELDADGFVNEDNASVFIDNDQSRQPSVSSFKKSLHNVHKQIQRTPSGLMKNLKFVTCSLDHTIHEYNIYNNTPMIMTGHADGINSVCYVNDYIVTASDDLTTKIYDNYKCIYTIRGHTENIVIVRAFPKRNPLFFITGSEDGWIKIYDSKTWKLLSNIHAGSRVWDITFFDGYLWAACDDSIVGYKILEMSRFVEMFGDRIYYTQNSKLNLFKIPSNVSGINLFDNKEANNVFEKSNLKEPGKVNNLIDKKVAHSLKISIPSTDNLFSISNLKKEVTELDENLMKLVVSKKFIALIFDSYFSVYSILGFRFRYKNNGQRVFFVSDKSFVFSKDNSGVVNDPSEIISTITLIEDFKEKASFSVTGVLIQSYQSKNISNIDNTDLESFRMPKNNVMHFVQNNDQLIIYLNNSPILKLSGCFNEFQACENKNFIYCIANNKIVVLKINYEFVKDLLEQEICCLECDDHYEILGELNCKPTKTVLSENVLFYNESNKIYYILEILNMTNNKLKLISIDTHNMGTMLGINDKCMYTLQNDIIEKRIDYELIRYQHKVLQDFTNDPTKYQIKSTFLAHKKTQTDTNHAENILLNYYTDEIMSFFMSFKLYSKALEFCKDINTKFNILVKLNMLDDAYKLASDKNKLQILLKCYMKLRIYDKAAVCANRIQDYPTMFLIVSLLNSTSSDSDKVLSRVLLDIIVKKSNNKNLVLMCAVKLGNSSLVGSCLKGTEFASLFNENY
ncbi:hypothetical protein EDEG_01323 [Edhazardia aedis USNM 41457]|uniref:Uncharacterized protein n=1 Tax=Edhazardia aedis (strain USNM 41457) TaxID=1003232 RepID=J8ZXN5_EDHAE|nr:hypothetical protein EDEG_01323 [Edhazardia aedis USNM 41457]|eukprot:EJW04453.1 hypothetical protein EDEG_01323 [Edhazardia aedis USNM 41457]